MSCTAVYHFQLEISTLDLWIVLSFSAACDQIRIDVYHAGRSDPAVPRRCGEKSPSASPGSRLQRSARHEGQNTAPSYAG